MKEMKERKSGKRIKRLAVNTGGGDAPGLNAVIRAVTASACKLGWEVYGLRDGYGSFLGGEPLMKLDKKAVRGISHLGGTILGTTNKNNPFETKVRLPGMKRDRLAAKVIVERFQEMGFDGLIAVGGDGSLRIAAGLKKLGLSVIGVPKTIDNDLAHTHRTFGFDTAVQTATEAIDKLYAGAAAHERVMVVEVMGRYAGWIALHAGLGGSADVILIPEIPFSMSAVAAHLNARKAEGRPYAVVCVAEGAVPKGGRRFFKGGKTKGRERQLGGSGEWVAAEITKRTKMETRTLVLGHLQRGGSPTTYDRLLALRYGASAVRLAAKGLWGTMVSFQPPKMSYVPLEKAVHNTKRVPLNGDTVQTARDLNICLGD